MVNPDVSLRSLGVAAVQGTVTVLGWVSWSRSSKLIGESCPWIE